MLPADPTLVAAFLQVLQPILQAALQSQADPAATRDALAQAQRVLRRLLPEQSLAKESATDSVPVSTEPLQGYLQNKFSDPTLRVTACRELPGGRSKRTLRVSLVAATSMPAELIFRQDKPSSAQSTTVRDEYPVMQALHDAGVRVAEPLWLEANAAALGAPFLVMRCVSGAAPGSYWSAANVSPAVGLALARALAALHRVTGAAVWATAFGDARRNVAQMLQQSAAQWRACEPAQRAALERGYDWLSARLPCIDGDSAVVHGDVHFGNLLAEAEHLICITDWEFAHAGHPAEDLAFCRSYIESIMSWEEFLREYRHCGGRSVTAQQLQFFNVWTYLRNLSFATLIRARLIAGAPADLQSLVIATDAQPRLEALLHSALSAQTPDRRRQIDETFHAARIHKDLRIMTNTINRRMVLAERPVGIPDAQHFKRDDQALAALTEGQVLVRNLYLSIDPAQRGWVNASANYSDPVPIGGVMRSLAVGVVQESKSAKFAVGEHYYGWFGWQDYCVATDAQLLVRFDPQRGAASSAVGIYGITGITACLALTEIGRPAAGETVLVSTAAGAVGSIVGQIARRLGCTVLGLTGTDDKVARCCAEFGYHGAWNYRQGLSREQLQALCPRGVDVYFDNTSGEISDAVWPLLNTRARIVQCGTAAIASWDPPPTGPRRDRDVLTKRLTQQGFIIFDHVARFPQVVAQLAAWVREGALVYREDIVDGLDNAPAALAEIYRGENSGKKMVRL